MAGDLSAARMMFGLALGAVLLVWAVLRTKMHPFLAMIAAAITIGAVGGYPLSPTTFADGTTLDLIGAISSGFGATMSSVGIVIGLGVMLGAIFEASGAARTTADLFIRIFGRGREEIALAFTGYVVSIPVFCDSGFVILSPIARSISLGTGKSFVVLGVSLGAGLLVTHSLVPPTPGPLAVCGMFGVDMGGFMIAALLLAVPLVMVCVTYARSLGRRYPAPSESGGAAAEGDVSRPGPLLSLAPLLLPLILIVAASVSSALGWTTGAAKVLQFAGKPAVAMTLGLMLAIWTTGSSLSRERAIAVMEEGIKSAGTVLLLTGGGGALGAVISTSGLGHWAAGELSSLGLPVALLPLAVSTFMRFVQGSGTVAMTTAASITAPIVTQSGASPLASAMACCVGALFFSSFNDSYFWVVNRTLGMEDARDQTRAWSFTTTAAWAVGALEVFVLSAIL